MKKKAYDIDFSIIICTYNPDERILKRCLQAVQNLDTEGVDIEVILVDNNSCVPVQSLAFLKDYSDAIPRMNIMIVKEQGVSHARIAAITAAVGEHIVYFDYDNEPEPGYLKQLTKLHVQYPQVAAWGPGQVTVDFIDGITNDIEDYARVAFQQRNDREIVFSDKQEWQSCYPYGTGLCTDAFFLKEYVLLALQGRFTLSGRKANRLSSGEDTQMVLYCISKGYYAGVAPGLKLQHIIPGNRANAKYLQRLAYGTMVCYGTCLLQVFPGYKKILEQQIIKPVKFSRQAVKKYLKSMITPGPAFKFHLATFLGTHAGRYDALNIPVPRVVRRIIHWLKIE